MNGTPTDVADIFDPTTGEFLGRAQAGPKGFANAIVPGIPGVSPPQRISRTGPLGVIEGAVTPPATGATAKDIGTAMNMKVLYKDALDSFEKYVSKTGRVQRATTSTVRNLPMVGKAIEENYLSYKDPEGVDVARKLDNLGDILLRLRSGAQINESEYQRLRTLLPKLGENPQTALANFRRFNTELLTTLRLGYKRAPNMFTPDVLNDLGIDQSELTGPAGRDRQEQPQPSGLTDAEVERIRQESLQ
jgi:hypothetical protein